MALSNEMTEIVLARIGGVQANLDRMKMELLDLQCLVNEIGMKDKPKPSSKAIVQAKGSASGHIPVTPPRMPPAKRPRTASPDNIDALCHTQRR